ncbi:uncharacterized protein FIESC28_00662 [Fusarium coffeatum]|uniref:Uncharacterized protein n=1 Tax=Fusarium coffeatum TaxID=231269 RepID=A0A366SD11_9HYPO|nr:uncharacterized protein FIESC28_00662 [Fusarium coffeatum]RBR26545.1 hypothetical protein FIESC28_00662 [Fusarium coffeatum]
MTPVKHIRLGPKQILRQRFDDEFHALYQDTSRWRKIKSIVKKPMAPPQPFDGIHDCESTRSVGDGEITTLASPSPPVSVNMADETVNTGSVADDTDGRLTIAFTHNQPCREDGEDEDFCCNWYPSSDDEKVENLP